jgi:hypothetical protein
MANGSIILGGFAASGSILTSENVLFGNFSGTNFEVDSIIANASASIEYVTSLVDNDAARVVNSFSTGSFNGAIYDYVLLDAGVGCRTGQFFVTQDNNSMDFTDTSTKAIGGDSTVPSISASFNGDNVDISIINGSGYTFKALVKKI